MCGRVEIPCPFTPSRSLGGLVDELSQSEIRHVWFARPIKQDIARLKVAMKNAALVGVVNGTRDRGHQFAGCPKLERIAAAFFQFSCQITPIDKFHAEIRMSLMLVR